VVGAGGKDIPGFQRMHELAHSMQRAMLCAMSLVLKSCFVSPLTVSLTGRFCGSAISSAVTRYGPIGANVARDFIAKNPADAGRARTVDEVHIAEHVAHRSDAGTFDARLPITSAISASPSKIVPGSSGSTMVSPLPMIRSPPCGRR